MNKGTVPMVAPDDDHYDPRATVMPYGDTSDSDESVDADNLKNKQKVNSAQKRPSSPAVSRVVGTGGGFVNR